MPPGGITHIFTGWIELHKICSPVLRQESHKSARAAAATRSFFPFWRLPDRLQIVHSNIFIKGDRTIVSGSVELVLSGLTVSPCRRLLQLFSPESSTFLNVGCDVGLGSFCLLLSSNIPSASHSRWEFGRGVFRKPPETWGKSELMQLFPSKYLGCWVEWMMTKVSERVC